MNPIKLSLFVMGVILLNGAVGEEHHVCTIEATMDPDGEACCVKCDSLDPALMDLMRNCPYLQKLYGYGDSISTAINGVELSSLPASTVGLQRLISDAGDRDTLILPGGYYTEGNISIDKNLTIYGKGYVVVDGRGNGAILNIGKDNPNTQVTLENINFINGHSSKGGAIINSASLSMTRCHILNSTADNGGGISNSGTLTLEDCEFRVNGARSGGAVYNEDNGTVVMKGCTLSSSYGEGSALFTSRGRVVLKDCEIKGNGGDASISCFVEGSYVQLDNCSIHDNYGRCFGGGIKTLGSNLTINGGAIFNNTAIYGGRIHGQGGHITLNHVVVYDNKATLGGGGMCSHNCTVILDSVNFGGNTAKKGGAIYNYYSEVAIRGSTTLSSNMASLGGAIYNNESTTLDLLDQTTIINNHADKGAGIYNVKGSQLKIKDKSNLIQNMAEDKGGAIYNEGVMSLKGDSIAKNIPDDIYNP